jgi:hypothetical protein
MPPLHFQPQLWSKKQKFIATYYPIFLEDKGLIEKGPPNDSQSNCITFPINLNLSMEQHG